MIRYEEIQPKDLQEITALYERYLNAGTMMQEQIREDFNSPGFFGVKAVDGDIIVGISYGKDDLTLTYPHPELEKRLKKVAAGHRVHYSDALVIREEYRGHEISTGLMKHLKKLLRQKGYQLVFGELWKKPDGDIPALIPLSHLGPQFYHEEVPGFYRDLDKYGITCPLCGIHCRCDAYVEFINVEE